MGSQDGIAAIVTRTYHRYMPYRGAIGPRIACAAHAAAEAIGVCSRCRTPLCDPCTLYFAADPFCRVCVKPARRAWIARIAAGVVAVVLVMAAGTGVMLAAIPSHVHRALAPMNAIVRHPENCRPVDQWLIDARHDLAQNRPHVALHDIALSRRDCGPDAERYRLEGMAYQKIGDTLAAIAAFRNYGDETGDYEPLRTANDREVAAENLRQLQLEADRQRHEAELQRRLNELQSQLAKASEAAARAHPVGDFPVSDRNATTPLRQPLTPAPIF